MYVIVDPIYKFKYMTTKCPSDIDKALSMRYSVADFHSVS